MLDNKFKLKSMSYKCKKETLVQNKNEKSCVDQMGVNTSFSYREEVVLSYLWS